MSQAYFFGYGSLVNRDTHAFAGAHPAKLSGWRRIWRHTRIRPVAYLTIVPDPDAEVEGLIAPVPDQDWAALDERERAYDRIFAQHQVRHDLPQSPDIVVYTIPDGKHDAPSEACPVLLSYIDVVTQGYLREFGEAGARRFFASTYGWDAPVIDDRKNPVYPRHRILSSDEQSFVDDMLRKVDARIMQNSLPSQRR